MLSCCSNAKWMRGACETFLDALDFRSGAVAVAASELLDT
jgi:hypothetical protein